jgi:hypothetical protein
MVFIVKINFIIFSLNVNNYLKSKNLVLKILRNIKYFLIGYFAKKIRNNPVLKPTQVNKLI